MLFRCAKLSGGGFALRISDRMGIKQGFLGFESCVKSLSHEMAST